MITVLDDEDVRARLRAVDAVAWMREAVLDEHAGLLVAPPRVHADLGGGRLVLTAGALEGRWFGYRSYDTLVGGEQLVVVHDAVSGDVRGIAVGSELGPRRVGAIGGVAADALARPDASVVGLVGAGVQARTQLWALAAVRRLEAVRVFSRDAARREAFTRRAAAELGVPVVGAPSARAAVDGADVVVLATSSAVPVVEGSWLAPGSYVTTLGPKQVGRAELGPDLVDAADVAVTDSLAQIRSYDPPNVLAGTPQGDRLVGLGAVLAGDAPGRRHDDDVVLFCSVGLAGTEAYLLDRLLGSSD